ncbi:hypothetical protein [Cohnella sp. REN36]|uniref:hypothetical protein n=1 Tax=Cohnella sp. REN36 TaxID=2887347 RepID=UPI001D145E50|nr:hypothetical protein [Cohnella sp. REN36]MCC3377054.1 hypothetical protein [Cohnella sp. REN36]
MRLRRKGAAALAALLLLLAIVGLAGCGEQGTKTGAQPPASSSSGEPLPEAKAEEDFPQPPPLRVTAGAATFEAPLGSYCWSSEGRGVCADMPYPPKLAEAGASVAVQAGEIVKLAFDRAPTSLQLSIDRGGELAESVEIRDGGFAAAAGKRLYVVNAEWPEGRVPYFLEVEGKPAVDTDKAAAYRKMAWDVLSDTERRQVTEDWREAAVEPYTDSTEWLIAPDPKGQAKAEKTASLEGKPLVSVTFHTEMDALLGPHVTIIDAETDEIVGFLPRM